MIHDTQLVTLNAGFMSTYSTYVHLANRQEHQKPTKLHSFFQFLKRWDKFLGFFLFPLLPFASHLSRRSIPHSSALRKFDIPKKSPKEKKKSGPKFIICETFFSTKCTTSRVLPKLSLLVRDQEYQE
ncbi:hypothetical protein OCU04_006405 [Sclerotinia nivalis]|uniref:Uncharacterized protein n=1 Tax=Sclerotinia nivalis TaxID=352851 RepID=A0A9X0AMZ9_9HELO|nr:hypothetical protein OCU04_006405 [Sclerotinia nivalis]